jgi:hypothetical protein
VQNYVGWQTGASISSPHVFLLDPIGVSAARLFEGARAGLMHLSASSVEDSRVSQ